MARRKTEEVKQGAPAWMSTYGDLVTLLLCFFVLLFSFSTIDNNKFKAIIQSMQGSLGVLDSGTVVKMEPLINTFPGDTNDEEEEFKKINIPTEKVVVSGIPIRDAFEEIENIAKLHAKYNFKRGKRIVLINAGAFGVFKDIKKVCVELCKHKSIQVAVVCGNNNLQKIKLESMGIKNLKVFGFIENIHELYKISSCMITKSGGITLTEALAVQLPLIIIKPVPGQEEENALYFEKKGAAIIAHNSYQIVSSTIDLINNPQILSAMRKNMRKIYNKSSSEKIVDDVLGSLKV